jgi:hypothetical protein
LATTLRQDAWLAFEHAGEELSSSRLSSSGFLSKASLILPRNALRMMQPPRHISAMPP